MKTWTATLIFEGGVDTIIKTNDDLTREQVMELLTTETGLRLTNLALEDFTQYLEWEVIEVEEIP